MNYYSLKQKIAKSINYDRKIRGWKLIMNNDMFAAIMAMYIITSALCGIFLLTLADTINPMII